MARVFIEAQHDPERGTLALAASVGDSRYAIEVTAVDLAEANAKHRQFLGLYAHEGDTVVTQSGTYDGGDLARRLGVA